jgi:threonine dehydrogenase-like Zn-dependent dehydrogenase
LTFEQAAAIGVPFATAWAALIGATQLKAGETILIVGASGSVGNAAVQTANWQQAHVFAAVKDSGPVPGAQAVINTKEDVRQQVLDLTGGKGVDVVCDTVSGLRSPRLPSGRLRETCHSVREFPMEIFRVDPLAWDLGVLHSSVDHVLRRSIFCRHFPDGPTLRLRNDFR